MNGAECLANRTIKVTIHVEKAERGDEEVSVQSVVAGHGLIISEDKDIMVLTKLLQFIISTQLN